jgi:succinate dehydrogenase flavin-adding protein (antitoxin of CptAB toxin-antitoxin module)
MKFTAEEMKNKVEDQLDYLKDSLEVSDSETYKTIMGYMILAAEENLYKTRQEIPRLSEAHKDLLREQLLKEKDRLITLPIRNREENLDAEAALFIVDSTLIKLTEHTLGIGLLDKLVIN